MENTSIVIVSYNGMQWIKKCIESALNQSIGIKIIVVDNNSIDGTVSFVKKEFPQVVLLEQTKNLGFGAANNIGISYALKNNTSYVFLLNQDAYLEFNTIDKLIVVSKNNPEFGILSPIHLNGDGSKVDNNFSKYIKVNETLFYDALKNDFLKAIYTVPFVNAAGWLLPKKTLETIGGFDPLFYHYAEDDNYCQRALFHDYKIGVVPSCYIKHDREFRKPKKVINNNDKIILRERYLKLKWANINQEVEAEILINKRKLKTYIPKLVIKFKFNKAKYCLRELNLINKIIPEINKSRKLNKIKGKHYI